MMLTRLMRTAFAVARSSSVATQVEVQEPMKLESMRILNGVLTLIIVGSLIAHIASPKAAGAAKPAPGPNAESAMAAEDEFTRVMRDNDPDGIASLLSDDWVVISARGEVGEGKAVFPEAIKSGHLTHTAYEVSEPRVRLYGNVALVTTKVHDAGTSTAKHLPFDAMERKTDVWLWKDGSWKCVLTHEAWEGAEKDQKLLNR
jgi:ketosteroid isomerase-like protein